MSTLASPNSSLHCLLIPSYLVFFGLQCFLDSSSQSWVAWDGKLSNVGPLSALAQLEEKLEIGWLLSPRQRVSGWQMIHTSVITRNGKEVSGGPWLWNRRGHHLSPHGRNMHACDDNVICGVVCFGYRGSFFLQDSFHVLLSLTHSQHMFTECHLC